jgi:hypothetical protein
MPATNHQELVHLGRPNSKTRASSSLPTTSTTTMRMQLDKMIYLILSFHSLLIFKTKPFEYFKPHKMVKMVIWFIDFP